MGKASVNAQRGRLYLLAKLPKKNGDGWTQTRIPMLACLIRPSTGRWRTSAEYCSKRKSTTTPLSGPTGKTPTTRERPGSKRLKQLYKKRVILGRTGEDTWNTNYMGRLRQANMTKVVNSREVADFCQSLAGGSVLLQRGLLPGKRHLFV